MLEVGVKDTVMRAPAEPMGGNIPEAGVTVNSLPGCSFAVNSSGLLQQTLHIHCLPYSKVTPASNNPY